MKPRLLVLAALAALTGGTIGAQQAEQPAPQGQPRFRAGANLVRVDAYVTQDGVPVTDLSALDFEVLEDNVPQRVESFQLVQPRGQAPVNVVREPNTVSESRDMARDADARVFVLFLDVRHVQLAGSYNAQGPMTRLLDRVIGQDDMVGVMTPEMSARDLALARRRETVAGMLKNNWYWGERNRLTTSDPREREIEDCYPNHGDTAGLAREMIQRRRASQTLNAIEDLILHLEGIREERKFVFLVSEGWLLSGPNPQLARALKDGTGNVMVPPPVAVGTDPSGRLRMEPSRGTTSFGACERERSLLAYSDQAHQFDQLLQRANRANVSFYPVDTRGLVVFDEPIGPDPPPPPSVDAARLTARYERLRELAINTDGFAILNTNAIDKALERVVQDIGAYYLLGYYSTNTKLDGRFRRLTVRVKRQGVDVRARPGYLAPSEAELASTRVDALMNGAKPGHTTIPPTISRALGQLAPTRGNVPLRLHTAGAPNQIWLTGEIDAATLKSADWQKGAQGRVIFQHDRGASPPIQADLSLAPGQSVFSVTPPANVSLAPGRYVVRVELLPAGTSVPMQTTTEANIPAEDWLVGGTGLALRRGPATGLAYMATADARFRRTERIRLEVPRASGDGTATARLLGRDGQPLNVALTVSERVDNATSQRFVVVDLMLAPLAQSDYVVEVTIAAGERKESATYAFRVIP
jgi:VWFA-related protein